MSFLPHLSTTRPPAKLDKKSTIKKPMLAREVNLGGIPACWKIAFENIIRAGIPVKFWFQYVIIRWKVATFMCFWLNVFFKFFKKLSEFS